MLKNLVERPKPVGFAAIPSTTEVVGFPQVGS